jgi:hypothetical protein
MLTKQGLNASQLAVLIAEDYVVKGLIPEDYKEEFAQELVRDFRRKVLEYASNVAASTARQVIANHLMSTRLAA